MASNPSSRDLESFYNVSYGTVMLEVPNPNDCYEPQNPSIHIKFEDGTVSNKIHLDEYLGALRRRFVWCRKNFSALAVPDSIKLSDDNRVLEAQLNLPLNSWEYNPGPRICKVDLSEHIGWDAKAKTLVVFGVREPRSIILCFDGTGNEFDKTNTNVVKVFSCLKKDDPDQQMVYYQTGIGTYSPQGAYQPISTPGQYVARLADQGVAWYLDQHVMSGYRFLMQTYRKGDIICVFGFSRGAYTARAFAGMLHAVGLLPLYNEEHVQKAYELYSTKDEGDDDVKRFKQTFSNEVLIDFVGVWDTVSSVGLVRSKELPHVKTNPSIITFRHAISLDETRAKFQCLHWADGKKGDNRDIVDVEEVFFAGNHCDVGGGNDEDDDTHRQVYEDYESDPTSHEPTSDYKPCLANISLRWMLNELTIAVREIQLDWRGLKRWNIPFNKAWGGFNIQGGEEQEVQDALARLWNQTDKKKWAWLEHLPGMATYQDENGDVKTLKAPHWAKSRIPLKCYMHGHYCVHPSVFYRIAFWKEQKVQKGLLGGWLTSPKTVTTYYSPTMKVLPDTFIASLRALNGDENLDCEEMIQRMRDGLTNFFQDRGKLDCARMSPQRQDISMTPRPESCIDSDEVYQDEISSEIP